MTAVDGHGLAQYSSVQTEFLGLIDNDDEAAKAAQISPFLSRTFVSGIQTSKEAFLTCKPQIPIVPEKLTI